MGLTNAQIIETAGAPLVCTSPLISLPHFEQVVVGPGNAYAVWSIGGNAAVGVELLWGTTQLFMGHIELANVVGGSITIEASATGGVGTWRDILTMALVGNPAGGVPNYFGPIELPGWNFKVRLFNADTIPAGFIGFIGGKGN